METYRICPFAHWKSTSLCKNCFTERLDVGSYAILCLMLHKHTPYGPPHTYTGPFTITLFNGLPYITLLCTLLYEFTKSCHKLQHHANTPINTTKKHHITTIIIFHDITKKNCIMSLILHNVTNKNCVKNYITENYHVTTPHYRDIHYVDPLPFFGAKSWLCE